MQKSFSLRAKITFIITGIFIGLLVTLQFKSAIPTSSFAYDKFQAEQALIKSYSDDQAALKSKIVNLREQVEEKQNQVSFQDSNLEILSTLKRELGLEVYKGTGVEITLDDGLFVNRDSENLDQSLVQAADLRDLVNILFSAQAKAISINDQRVIASTPISAVGNTILVNNFHMLPPFNIIAIGDIELLMQRLNDKNALVDLKKRVSLQNVRFAFDSGNLLVAPVYNGDFRLKYIKDAKDLSNEIVLNK